MLNPSDEPTRELPATAVVYGSTSGCTQDAAEEISQRLSDLLGQRVPCLDVGLVGMATLARFDVLVVGASTWNIGELQADWQARLEELAALDLRDTRMALFGAGDAVTYPDTFGDAVGIVADRLEAAGGVPFCAVAADDYDFDDSLARRGEELVGLLLDYDNDEERVPGLIDAWCHRLAEEIRTGATGGAAAAFVDGADRAA